MNRLAQHKFDRLKKLTQPQKADVFSIPVHTEYIADDLPVDDEATKDAEIFTVDAIIAVKETE
jgi:hypothetical protein